MLTGLIRLCVNDILMHPDFQALKTQVHHGNKNSAYTHCIDVANMVYKLCQFFDIDYQKTIMTVRAGLLHDFYTHDWHKKEHQGLNNKVHKGIAKIFDTHIFCHGYIAMCNAQKNFTLSDIEKNAIRAHMFPFCNSLPKYSVGWIVTLADKIVSIQEVSENIFYHFNKTLYLVSQYMI